MKIYLISDYKYFNQVQEALEGVSSVHTEVAKADYYNIEEEITPQIVSAIKNCEVVVADISNERPNLYYEIGIAHALNKPVILVSQTDNFNKYSLLTYRFYKYDINATGVKQLTHYFNEILGNSTALDELKPLKAKKNLDFPTHHNIYANNVRLNEILNLKGSSKNNALEKWLYSLLREIPGFEVTQNAALRDREYDFIVWNMNGNADLERLGNPIPIEVKASNRINNNDIYSLVTKAKLQGFQSFILITTAEANSGTYQLLESLKHQGGVSIILLDKSILEEINHPQDLLKAIIKSYRNLFIS